MDHLTTHPMVRFLRSANTTVPEGGPVSTRCVTSVIGPFAKNLFSACLWALDVDGRANSYRSDLAAEALVPLLDQTDGVQVGFNGTAPIVEFHLRRRTPPADRITVAEEIHRSARQVDPCIPFTTVQADDSWVAGAGTDPFAVCLYW